MLVVAAMAPSALRRGQAEHSSQIWGSNGGTDEYGVLLSTRGEDYHEGKSECACHLPLVLDPDGGINRGYAAK